MDQQPSRAASSRDFRLLFWAGTVFYFGGMITYVAIPYQLYTITGSNAAVVFCVTGLTSSSRRRPMAILAAMRAMG